MKKGMTGAEHFHKDLRTSSGYFLFNLRFLRYPTTYEMAQNSQISTALAFKLRPSRRRKN